MKCIIRRITATVVVLLTCLSVVPAQETAPAPKTKPTIPTIQSGAKWLRLRRDIEILDTPDKDLTISVRHANFRNSPEVFELDKIKEINGKSYFEIKNPPYGNGSTCVREDLNQGKIYLYSTFFNPDGKKSEAEVVLFDYNSKVGDTIRVYSGIAQEYSAPRSSKTWVASYDVPFLLKVKSIDTKNLFGASRIVYTLERVFPDGIEFPKDFIYDPWYLLETCQWIEGIGYSFGFLFNQVGRGLTPGFHYSDYVPLRYTSPRGDVYNFHPAAAMWDFSQPNRTSTPLSGESLNVQIARDKLGLTIRVDDGKHHDLTIYRYDGTPMVGTISFYESYALALPSTSGEKILIVVDDETIPYVL